jgi:hypothetical protein
MDVGIMAIGLVIGMPVLWHRNMEKAVKNY